MWTLGKSQTQHPLLSSGTVPSPLWTHFASITRTSTGAYHQLLIMKAQHRMFFLQQLRKLKLPAELMVQFYAGIRVHLHHRYHCMVHNQGQTDHNAMCAAEKVIGRAGWTVPDPYPGHSLVNLLSSGRTLRSIWTRTSHHNSFSLSH